ncbi:MAG: porin family protein [Helicobacter sp.]|nr:porin family protein [Helicobacter sp.]
MGIEGGMINSKFKGDDISLKDNVPAFGIKMGYRFTPNFRTYGAYNYVTKAKGNYGYVNNYGEWIEEAEINVHKFLVGFDITPEIATNTRAVVGVYGGVAIANFDVTGVTTDVQYISTISASGSHFIYGAKLGALYEIGAGEIEVGFKADQVSYKVEDAGKLKQTNLGLYIGYNYKF